MRALRSPSDMNGTAAETSSGCMAVNHLQRRGSFCRLPPVSPLTLSPFEQSFTASSEYHFPEWQGRTPYFRADFQHSTAQKSLLPQQDSNNGVFDNTLPGLPVVNNLSLRAGLRFNGLDISAYANNVTNAHPLMFESRDLVSDNLYYARGVRPRAIGITATYRY
jgi:hypothetical protein